MNILAAILYFKMAAMKSNVLNIFIIMTGRMVILMSRPTLLSSTNQIVKYKVSSYGYFDRHLVFQNDCHEKLISEYLHY